LRAGIAPPRKNVTALSEKHSFFHALGDHLRERVSPTKAVRGPHIQLTCYLYGIGNPTTPLQGNVLMTMRVRKAVFPAAGLGTRFLPATKAQPKEMLPLVDKPIIQYGVEEALAAGCDQIIIITGRGKQAIEDHFDVSYELEKMLEEKKKTDLLQIVRQISDMIHVAYVRQKEALGLGHAVLMARELVGNEPFAVLLADDVIDAPVPCLKQMMQVFEQTQCSVIATQMVEGRAISAYGVLDVKPVDGSFGGRLFEIKNMVEKPKPEEAPSNLAITGRYILTPTIFQTLSETPMGTGGELQLTDGMRLLLKKEKMYAYIYEGKRHDTGDKLGFLKATVEFALKRPDLGEEFRLYLKELKF
jgi:UTP--glucose-1-phosphate uridylyltransferase